MASPRDPTARGFYRAGRQRLEDGESLRPQGRFGGAVYLAGYGIECGLKSVLVEQTPQPRRPALVASFRGSVAHDFDWLRRRYRDSGGSAAPAEVLAAFLRLDTWGGRTEMQSDDAEGQGCRGVLRRRPPGLQLDRRENLMIAAIAGEVGGELASALDKFVAGGGRPCRRRIPVRADVRLRPIR